MTVEGPIATALAWLHPAIMMGVIGASAWAMRLGLTMRSARARRQARPKTLWRGHVRLAKFAFGIGFLGMILGPVTWVAIRDQPPMSSLHGKVGVLASLLAAVTYTFGRRLEQGRGQPRDAHAFVGIVAVLTAVLALLTGLELLP